MFLSHYLFKKLLHTKYLDTYTILIGRADPIEKEFKEYGHHYNVNDLPYDQFDLEESISKVLRRPEPPPHNSNSINSTIVFLHYNKLLESDLLRVQAIHVMRTLA